MPFQNLSKNVSSGHPQYRNSFSGLASSRLGLQRRNAEPSPGRPLCCVRPSVTTHMVHSMASWRAVLKGDKKCAELPNGKKKASKSRSGSTIASAIDTRRATASYNVPTFRDETILVSTILQQPKFFKRIYFFSCKILLSRSGEF